MRRREFIALVSSAAAACPLAARAQQPERMRRVGVLMGLSANNTWGQSEAVALQRGLQELGWTEGRNLEVKYSWPGAELVASNPQRMSLLGSSARSLWLVGLPC